MKENPSGKDSSCQIKTVNYSIEEKTVDRPLKEKPSEQLLETEIRLFKLCATWIFYSQEPLKKHTLSFSRFRAKTPVFTVQGQI